MTSTVDPVREIARAVLYEGYLLWPYRRAASKHQRRETLAGVYPQPYSIDRGEDDPWQLQTQCLLEPEPEAAVDVEVRFLQVVRRDVARVQGDQLVPVPELTAGGQQHQPGEEATEREVTSARLAVDSLLRRPHHFRIDIPAGAQTEWLIGNCGRRVGALVRHWQSLCGEAEVRAEPVQPGAVRITVQVRNTTAWRGDDRQRALRRTLVATHTVARAHAGEFASLLEPPEHLRAAAQECRNTGIWPVLVGAPGDRQTMLSAPVVLSDYPLAPAAAGALDLSFLDQSRYGQGEAATTTPYNT